MTLASFCHEDFGEGVQAAAVPPPESSSVSTAAHKIGALQWT